MRRGKGTLASTRVSRMACRPLATNNLFAPEMAKNSPSETRTSRMAYGSKSLLPSSANWINRFQSICGPSIDGMRCYDTSYHTGPLLRQPGSQDYAPGGLGVHPFNPLSARCGGHKWIRKVLCFTRNLVVLELHDAHGVG